MGGKKAVLSFGEDNCISDIFKKDFLRSLSLGKYNPNNKYLFIHSADVTYYNLTDPEGVLIRSDKLIHDNRRRSPREALKHAYIQPNSKYNLSNIIIDIDREDFSISDFEELNIPLPNMVVMNKDYNKAHVWYMLSCPVWLQYEYRYSDNKITSYQYAQAVYNALVGRLKADTHFNRSLCKNPFYQEGPWKTLFLTDHKYTLAELSDHLDLMPPERKKASKSGEPVQILLDLPDFDISIREGQRNQRLFDETRKQAYIFYRDKHCSEETLYSFCMGILEKLNDSCLDSAGADRLPLSGRELSDIAHSISSWCTSKKFNEKLLSKYTDEQRQYALEVRRRNREINLLKIRKAHNKNKSLSNRELSTLLTGKEGKGFSTWSINQAMAVIDAEERRVKEYQERKEEVARNRAESELFAPGIIEKLKVESFLSVCSLNEPDINVSGLNEFRRESS